MNGWIRNYARSVNMMRRKNFRFALCMLIEQHNAMCMSKTYDHLPLSRYAKAREMHAHGGSDQYGNLD